MEQNTLPSMLNLGIYRLAMSLSIDLDSAIREAVYCRFHKTEILPPSILSFMETELAQDEYYRGYGSGIYGEVEVDELKPFFKENEEPRKTLEKWYRVRQALKMIDLDLDIKSILDCESIYGEAVEKVPLILVNARLIYDMIDSGDYRDADKRALLAMYLGMLSIIGQDKYKRTSSSMIKCRMFGAKNEDELSTLLEDETFARIYRKYTTRHYYRSFLEKIKLHRMITEVGINRSTYISVKLGITELVEAIAKERPSSLKAEMDKELKEALARFFPKASRG